MRPSTATSSDPGATGGQSHRYATSKRAVLFVSCVGAFLTPFMGASINVAIPTIGRDLGMDTLLLGWVATGYLLAAAVFLVPFGRMADILGRKRMYLWGIIVFTLFSLACGLAPNGITLIVCRILQGIGGAMIFGTSMAILTSAFPPHERGKALGINVATVYAGLSVGPFIGGILTGYLGWRSVFFFNVPLGLLVVAATVWKLKDEWAEAKGQSFDVVGSIIYGASVASIVYGLSLLPAWSGAWLVAAGVVVFVVFVLWERRLTSPVLNISLFSGNSVFALSNLAALLNYAATFALNFLLSIYLQSVRGLDPQVAGLALVAQPIMMTIASPFAGRLSDRVEPRIVASAGMTLTALGLALFVVLDQSTALWYVVLCLLVTGAGLGLFSSPNSNAIMSSVHRSFYGVASAMLGTMRLSGQMLSLAIAMLVISIFVGRATVTVENAASFMQAQQTTLILFSALCVVGIFASMVRGNLRPKD